MLDRAFEKVYAKFRMNFFQRLLCGEKENLSSTEELLLEAIHTLGTPTVGEFAKFVHISMPNATYRIKTLAQKGFLEKIKPQQDRREIRLKVTDKFYEYADLSAAYVKRVLRELERRLSSEQAAELEKTLTLLSDEIMIMEECRQ